MNHRSHQPEPDFTITITDIAMPTDAGVGKIGDMVVFVPGTVPGDQAIVRIVRREKRYAYGELVSIEGPSEFRVEPACPHFGQCGGCTIQSLDYAKQTEIKEMHLRQSLRRIGRLDIPEHVFETIVPSPSIYWYRSKIELSFGMCGQKVIAGMRPAFPSGESNALNVVPVHECMIFSRSLGKILSVIEDFVHHEGLFPYDEKSGKGELRHLILKESKASGKIMVIIETKGSRPVPMENLYFHLRREVPGVASLCRIINNRPGSFIDYSRVIFEAGDHAIDEELAGLRFRIYPGSFFQPNPAGAALLYERIREIAERGAFGRCLGLYCGMAPIELVMSRHARHVAGIDSVRVNIENARENAVLNAIKNCSFTAGRVEDMIIDRRAARPDVIVVDPPRAGLSQKGINVILTLNPSSVTYVSCNPATLARDLGILTSKGFHIHRITPFDLFPHTSHLETLVVLGRSIGKNRK